MELDSAEDVIKCLGGYRAVAELVGAKTDAVYNWRTKFPAWTYPRISEALAAKQRSAPQSLWHLTRKAAS